jgi:hypothetical protein
MKTSRATLVPARHRTPSTLHHSILAEADRSDGSELDQPRWRSENDPLLPAPFHPRPNRPHPYTQLTTPSRTRRTAAQSVTADTTTHHVHHRSIKPPGPTPSLLCSPFFSQPLSSPLRTPHWQAPSIPRAAELEGRRRSRGRRRRFRPTPSLSLSALSLHASLLLPDLDLTLPFISSLAARGRRHRRQNPRST